MVDDHNREAVRPLVGTRWVWEPDKPGVTAFIEVTAVNWNGEEWLVKARVIAGPVKPQFRPYEAGEYWNDLSRFWEACHRVSKRPGPAGYHPEAVRRGTPLPEERMGA